MRLIDNMSMKVKLALAFLLMLMVTLGVSAFAVNRIGQVNGAAAEIRENWLPSVGHLGQLAEALAHQRQLVGTLILVPEQERPAVRQLIASTWEQMETARRAYAATVTVAEERRLWTLADGGIDRQDALTRRFMAMLDGSTPEAAGAFYMGDMQAASLDLQTAVDAVTKFNLDHGVAAAERGEQVYADAVRAIGIASGVAALIALGLGLLLRRSVALPLVASAALMDQIARGNLDATVAAGARKDEIGAMTRALESLRQTSLRARTLEQEAAAGRAAAETDRRQQQLGLADRVERQIGSVAEALAQAVQALEAGIGQLSRTADGTQQRAAGAATGASQAAANVQTVAAAAEELASSVAEITRQVAEAAQSARRAAEDVRAADAEVTGLSEAASRIGDVVRLIGDIASQTNLLALNATIEAARAGEAGKGFAVVAGEVKALASQTAKATGEIGAQIGAIQGATSRAVDTIKGIATVVGQVDEIATAIAAAVEEQLAATQEISRNVQEAASGTTLVSGNLTDVRADVEATRGALGKLSGTTGTVASQGQSLQGELRTLLQGLRAA